MKDTLFRNGRLAFIFQDLQDKNPVIFRFHPVGSHETQ